MDSRNNERTETTRETILRMSDTVENAPYALESAQVVDVKLAASCGMDDPNLPSVERAASCSMDAGSFPHVEPASKKQK